MKHKSFHIPLSLDGPPTSKAEWTQKPVLNFRDPTFNMAGSEITRVHVEYLRLRDRLRLALRRLWVRLRGGR